MSATDILIYEPLLFALCGLAAVVSWRLLHTGWAVAFFTLLAVGGSTLPLFNPSGHTATLVASVTCSVPTDVISAGLVVLWLNRRYSLGG